MKTSTCNQTYMYSWYFFYKLPVCFTTEDKNQYNCYPISKQHFPTTDFYIKDITICKVEAAIIKGERGWLDIIIRRLETQCSRCWWDTKTCKRLEVELREWSCKSLSVCVRVLCVYVCFEQVSCITTCSYKIGALLWMGWQKGYEHLSHWQYRVRVAGRGEVHVRERKGEGGEIDK